MIISIIYVLIEILLFCLLTLTKHSEKKSDLFAWIPIYIIFIMAFHAMCAGILAVCNINISLVSIGICDFILTFFCYLGICKYGRQNYSYCKTNIYVWLLITVAIILFGFIFFGRYFELHFWSVDAATHCQMAQKIAVHHTISNNLFFSALNNGIAMMIFEPFIGAKYFYKVFIAMEILDLWLAIILFYSLLLVIKPNGNKFVATCFTFFYAIGYPMYAIIFGFSYFGASLSLIAACIFLMEVSMRDNVERKFIIIALNILLFSLFVCYTYFVPIICLTIFCYVIYSDYNKNVEINIKKQVLEECKIFFMPIVFGLFFSASNISELGTGGGITNEGACYFEPYSNFVLLSYFCVYCLLTLKKSKELLSIRILTFFSFAFFIVLLVMYSFGKASTYYLGKIYNLFWLAYFLLAYYSIVISFQNYEIIKKGMLAGTVLVCFTTFLSYFPIKSKNDITRTRVKFTGIPDIYVFNSLGLFQEYVRDDLIQSYRTVKDNFISDSDSVIVIGDEVKCGWFKTVVEDADTISYDINLLDNKICSNTKYLYCINSRFVDNNITFIENLGNVIYKDQYSELIEIQ